MIKKLIIIVIFFKSLYLFSFDCDSTKGNDAQYQELNKLSFHIQNFVIDSTIIEFPCYYKEIIEISNLIINNPNNNLIFPDDFFDLVRINTIKIINCNNINEILKKIYSCKILEMLTIENSEIRYLDSLIKLPKNLETLMIINCNLDYIPKSLCIFNQIKTLLLDFNRINEIDSTLLNFKNLEVLHLRGDNLINLPEYFYTLDNLKYLLIRNQKFKEPDSILKKLCNMKNLKGLAFDSNNISSLPNEIFLLENLEDLSISYNNLKELSKDISKLKKLWCLVLVNNKLTRLPDEIIELKDNLFYLYIYNNNFTDEYIKKLKNMLPNTTIIYQKE